MKKPYPVVIAFMIGSLIFLGGYWFLLMPQVRLLAALQESLDASNGSTTSSTQKKTEETRINTLKAKANQLLPVNDNEFDLSVQVEALAKKTGLSLTSFKLADNSASTIPQTSTAGAAVTGLSADVKKITINVSVAGSYKAIQQFVTGFTSLERIIQIDQVTITSDTSKNLTAQIVGFAYYLTPEVASTPSVTKPSDEN